MMKPRRIGVILAAGRGRRMGQTKQLATLSTPDGPVPLVAAAFDAILPICDIMIIVLGHEARRIVAALGGRVFHQAMANPDAPMYESIRCGLRFAQVIESSASVVLQPGDHPQVADSTLRTLTDWSLKRPDRAIIPQYGGAGGHPVLIPPNIVAQLLDASCPAGLGDFWTTHPELCHRVQVDDLSVLRDVDTPGDLP
jgi:CTP:molybdopterin cytidylyltransferase MocA